MNGGYSTISDFASLCLRGVGLGRCMPAERLRAGGVGGRLGHGAQQCEGRDRCAERVFPKLTAIESMHAEMKRLAAEVLLRSIDNPNGSMAPVVLDPRLQVRDSTVVPPRPACKRQSAATTVPQEEML